MASESANVQIFKERSLVVQYPAQRFIKAFLAQYAYYAFPKIMDRPAYAAKLAVIGNIPLFVPKQLWHPIFAI
jgi:hypothetical protein